MFRVVLLESGDQIGLLASMWKRACFEQLLEFGVFLLAVVGSHREIGRLVDEMERDMGAIVGLVPDVDF